MLEQVPYLPVGQWDEPDTATHHAAPSQLLFSLPFHGSICCGSFGLNPRLFMQ